jgi:hypothetical protein
LIDKSTIIFHSKKVKFLRQLLTIPGHISHVIQAFDLTVAGPLKGYFADKLAEALLPSIEELRNGIPNIEKGINAGVLRRKFVEAFLDAHSKATTYSNITAGFRTAGMVPLDPSLPITNPRIPRRPNIIEGVRRIGTASSNLLTDIDNLNKLYVKVQKEQPNIAIVPSIGAIVEKILDSNLTDGILLSKLPDLFEDEGNFVHRVRLVN